MICNFPKCNKEIPEGSVYCPYCGEIVGDNHLSKFTKKANTNSELQHKFKTLKGLKHISGIPGVGKKRDIQIKFDNDVIVITKGNFALNNIVKSKEIRYSASEISKIVIYRETRTVVIKLRNSEIVLKARNIFLALKLFGNFNNIDIDKIGTFNKPKLPVGVSLIGIIGITLCLLIAFVLKQELELNISEFDSVNFLLLTILIMITLALSFGYFEFLRGKKWAFDIISIIFLLKSTTLIFINALDKHPLFALSQMLILPLLIVLYLRSSTVYEYFVN